MKQTDWLSIGVAAVAYVLGAFGGFLQASAPPAHPLHDTNAGFALGVASFVALFIYLLIAATVRRQQSSSARLWFVIAGVSIVSFLGLAWTYHRDLTRHEFEYPGDSGTYYSAGSQLTPRADSVVAADRAISKTNLVAGFGGIRRVTAVWPEASIDEAHARLTALYILFVLSIATALFALTEGVLSREKAQGPPAGE